MERVSEKDPEELLREISQNGISQNVCINDLGTSSICPIHLPYMWALWASFILSVSVLWNGQAPLPIRLGKGPGEPVLPWHTQVAWPLTQHNGQGLSYSMPSRSGVADSRIFQNIMFCRHILVTVTSVWSSLEEYVKKFGQENDTICHPIP